MLPNWHQRIAFDRTFNEGEFRRLSQSVRPETMDRRWYANVDDGWLYIVRSWTDRCMLRLKVRTTAPHQVIETLAYRDKRRYRNADTTEEIYRLNQAIDEIVTAEGR
jgi:hypothetical protein